MQTQETEVAHVANLTFARGAVGRRNPLETPELVAEHGQELADNTVELTRRDTAFCGDERFIVRFAQDGQSAEEIAELATPQLFGGIGLSAAKACAAADAEILRDCKDMNEATNKISDVLVELGYELAAHDGCGAAASVESSVANPIPDAARLQTLGLFAPTMQDLAVVADKNAAAKQQKLQNGFYSDFDKDAYNQRVIDEFPQNFAYLQGDPNDAECNGHNGSSLYVVTDPDHGFRRNGKAFCVTAPFMWELANKLGRTDEEKARIYIGFAEDTAEVGAGIVCEDFAVFAEAA